MRKVEVCERGLLDLCLAKGLLGGASLRPPFLFTISTPPHCADAKSEAQGGWIWPNVTVQKSSHVCQTKKPETTPPHLVLEHCLANFDQIVEASESCRPSQCRSVLTTWALFTGLMFRRDWAAHRTTPVRKQPLSEPRAVVLWPLKSQASPLWARALGTLK